MKKVISFLMVFILVIGLSLPVSAAPTYPEYRPEWYETIKNAINIGKTLVPSTYRNYLVVESNGSFYVFWSYYAYYSDGITIYITNADGSYVSDFTFSGLRYDSSQDYYFIDPDSNYGFNAIIVDMSTTRFYPSGPTLIYVDASYSLLKMFAGYAEGIRDIGYTESSWNRLQSAINDAYGFMFTFGQYQAKAEYAIRIDELIAAADGLILRGSEPEFEAVRYNDNDPEVRYSGAWSYYRGNEFYNGDEHFTNQAGAYAELTFDGTSINYIAATSNNLGKCDIYIDGVLEQSGVDAYSPTLEPQKSLFFKDGLAPGQHIIKIVVTGERNADATDCFVTVDAFEVDGDGSGSGEITNVTYNDNAPEIRYTGAWTYYSGPEFYDGDEHFSNQQGAYAELTFYGTSISYIAATSNNLGMCDIYIDGILEQPDVDAYSPGLEPQQVLFYKDGLTAGQHTIKIVVTGNRNESATDNYVTVDAFEVG